MPIWVYVVGLAVACYICGLLSFAVGRLATRKFRDKYFPILVKDALVGHCISSGKYGSDDKCWRLYERLWVEIRQQRKHIVSFSLLRRYWVMAATYDGVAISCLTWTVVLIAEPPVHDPSYANLVLPLVTFLGALISSYQGFSFFKYQIYEIVATIAASKETLDL
jgi:hypothetical protein